MRATTSSGEAVRPESRVPEHSRHVVLILVSAAWLAVVMVLVAVCRMAAHGDVQPGGRAEKSPRGFDGLSVSARLAGRASSEQIQGRTRAGSGRVQRGGAASLPPGALTRTIHAPRSEQIRERTSTVT